MVSHQPIRVTVVVPAPVPYREPLFAGLAAGEELALDVIHLAARPRGWDMGADWFTVEHPYRAHTLAARQRARPGRTPVIVPRGLLARLSALDPDVVVVSEFGPAAVLARAWCSAHRRGLVHFSEVTAASASAIPAPQRLLHAVLVRHADALIGASTAARERMVGDGGDPHRAFVSLQSVDATAIRRAVAERRDIPAETPRAIDVPSNRPALRLLCVARLVPDKNLATLVRASAGVPGVRLELAGDGPLRPELTALAGGLGVDLRLLGPLSVEEVAHAYARADAFALISRHEPFGVALREAVAAGLPLIASARAGAVGDVAVADRNAFVVDPDDDVAIAAAVRALVAVPTLRVRYAAASRAIDAEWPIERSVTGFLNGIRAAAARRMR